MQFNVTIDNTAETFACSEEDSLLKSMEQLRCRGIPVGCRNGGCGVCKVRVVAGSCEKKKASRAVLCAEEEAQGCVLACKTYPRSDMVVEAMGKMARAIVTRKSASFSFEFTTTWQVVQQDKET